MALTMSIAVVEGLSGTQVADRLDANVTQETVNFYAAAPAASTHSRSRTVVLDNPYDDAPMLADERVLARLSRATTVALFALVTGIEFYSSSLGRRRRRRRPAGRRGWRRPGRRCRW
jgi:hypothetical protein